jgi:hypothetical protein
MLDTQFEVYASLWFQSLEAVLTYAPVGINLLTNFSNSLTTPEEY